MRILDVYFSGTNNDEQVAEINSILDSMIEQLLKDPTKRFSYVEMKFFAMWWNNQEPDTKAAVRQLVAEGRFKFINAGWSMHDEACTHYEDMINNMMLGHEFLM